MNKLVMILLIPLIIIVNCESYYFEDSHYNQIDKRCSNYSIDKYEKTVMITSKYFTSSRIIDNEICDGCNKDLLYNYIIINKDWKLTLDSKTSSMDIINEKIKVYGKLYCDVLTYVLGCNNRTSHNIIKCKNLKKTEVYNSYLKVIGLIITLFLLTIFFLIFCTCEYIRRVRQNELIMASNNF